MQTTTTTHGKLGVANTLATTSIQKTDAHEDPRTKMNPQHRQKHPQTFKHTQTHTAKTTCMQTTTCNISCTNIVTLLIATPRHNTQLQPSPNSWHRGRFVTRQKQQQTSQYKTTQEKHVTVPNCNPKPTIRTKGTQKIRTKNERSQPTSTPRLSKSLRTSIREVAYTCVSHATTHITFIKQ